MADPTPSKRISLARVLIEAGKAIDEVNAILTAKGHAPLAEDEAEVLFDDHAKQVENEKLAADGAKVLAALSASDLKAEEEVLKLSGAKPAKPKLGKPVATPTNIVAGKWPLMESPLSQQVGTSPDGTPIVLAQAMANDFCHKVVDTCKVAFGPAWEAEYRKIKWPGGAESMMTDESKRAAYLFAFESFLALKMTVKG